MLTTISEEIKFNSNFYKFFDIIGGEITPKVNNNEDIPNINDYAIFIDPNDLAKVDDLDDDSLYNNYISNGKFYIKNIVDPNEEPIEILEENEKEIYVSDTVMDMRKSNRGLVPFKKIDDEEKLFEISIMNRELTKPLYDLMNLLKRNRGEDFIETIDYISQRFLDLLIESGIDANVIAAEFIINRLIRSLRNMYERPDFSKEKLEPYQILTVPKALERNPSITIGLSFENIKRQILSDEMYELRTDTCFTDALFKPRVYADNINKYRKLAADAKEKGLL